MQLNLRRRFQLIILPFIVGLIASQVYYAWALSQTDRLLHVQSLLTEEMVLANVYGMMLATDSKTAQIEEKEQELRGLHHTLKSGGKAVLDGAAIRFETPAAEDRRLYENLGVQLEAMLKAGHGHHALATDDSMDDFQKEIEATNREMSMIDTNKAFKKALQKLKTAKAAEINAHLSNSLRLGVATGVGAAIASILLSIWIMRTITIPLQMVAGSLELLAKGDIAGSQTAMRRG